MNGPIDLAGLEPAGAGYLTGDALALRDRSLLPKVQAYRRSSGARMTAVDLEGLHRKLPPGDFLVSRKMDGEFAVLVWDGAQAFTLNAGGTVRVGLPLALEAASLLARAGVRQALLVGELYVSPGGGRERFYQVSSILRRPESRAQLEQVRFAAFDLIEVDGRPGGPDYAETWRTLRRILGPGRSIHPVQTALAQTAGQVQRLYERWVEGEGAEGLVVRGAAGAFKVKPRHSIDAVVVGFAEGLGDRQGMLSELLVALMRPDGTFHLLGRVGGGISDVERRALLCDLKDLTVESGYVEAGPEHVGYQMVRPEVVIELSCLDFLASNTRGAPIERMVLDWRALEARYEPLRRLPLASVIAPVFVRRRPDKSVNPFDLRLQQVGDLVEVPSIEVGGRPAPPPPSALLRREVYVKTLKGNRMVRKLLLWKTNKETTGDYPAYVLFFTDFSPARKVPLERALRVSSTRAGIDALWDALAREKIVRGWERVEDAGRQPIAEHLSPGL